MNPLRWALAGVVAAAAIYGGIAIQSCRKAQTVDAAVQQAGQHHDAATAAAAQGDTHEQEAQAHQHSAEQIEPTLTTDSADVARLRAELAKLRAAASIPALPVAAPVVFAPVVDLAPVVAKQDQLIASQDKKISDLEAQKVQHLAQILDLKAAIASDKVAYQQSQQEALQLRVALAAQEGLTRSALWKGRIQGFAVGFGGGYLAGRLH